LKIFAASAKSAAKAPGHPEYHLVSGVETTTAPLDRALATSVGMAIGQKMAREPLNKPGFDIFDCNIYTILRDGA